MRRHIFILLLMGLGLSAVSAQTQKKKGKTAAKPQATQPVAERKPRTAEIDSLISNYHFTKAIDMIGSELGSQPNETYTAQLKQRRLIAERGRNMLEATQKIVFIDSQVVSRERMLQAIRTDHSCGRMLTPTRTRELLGLSGQPIGTAFVNDFADHTLFSLENANGKAKLMEASLFNDKWSTPTPLAGIGDSLSVEAYPFLMADGTTLYFAAKDEDSSLGGYDIYVTRYNSDAGAFLKPENVGMPFNSTANDYLMVYDEVNNLGWLVSDRHQPADKVCVYTFIPSETRELYDNVSANQLRSLAALQSIKDTQVQDKQGVENALARLAQVRKAEPVEATATNFCFDVAFGIRYHSLEDFHNPQAKAKAREWADQQYRRDHLAALLAENRLKYGNAKSTAERNALAPVILRQEHELEQQDKLLFALANEIRILENAKQ